MRVLVGTLPSGVKPVRILYDAMGQSAGSGATDWDQGGKSLANRVIIQTDTYDNVANLSEAWSWTLFLSLCTACKGLLL